MRAPHARARRRVLLLAIPGLLLAASTAEAAPPDEPPPSTSLDAVPLEPTPEPTEPTPEPTEPVAPPTEPAPPSTDAVPAEPTLHAEELVPDEELTADKALTSRLAETDPALLGRTDATPIQVVVKLDHDSTATYQGSIDGLAATSPAVTGEPLTGETAAEQAYQGYLAAQEGAFVAELGAAVPDAAVGQSLRTVYGGLALTIPANAVEEVLAIPGVVAVQRDAINQLTTDSSTEFIGADAVYSALGGDRQAGAGVIFGVLDSGAWPEHLSFADQGNLVAPPPKADGTARTCDFGDNPLTVAVDVFACNDKLISGQAFLDAYNSDPARLAAEPFPDSARDSNGHGTHTGSTAAGNVVESAPIFGVERGPIQGVAPGAWVAVYKTCGIGGCYSSDNAAAVAQAILDGVDVINYSISGGTQPFSDPVELAFLDAYAAGVLVAASAGNNGPAASTVNHLSPWVITVAASTQTRAFQSTLTLTGNGGTTATFSGVSITAGAGPAPVVLSSAAPYSRPLCDAPAAPGTFTGVIVACQRGVNARVDKGYNVRQGGAVGMILYNPTLADAVSDNHWLPTVHLADGRPFLAFMGANAVVTASFTPGEAVAAQGDVMAAFSSRGPAGPFLKPDITAPGVQILAGHTPVRESISGGPPGEYFQAIAGTSMSAPHVAGAAILVKALDPSWTPGQIKSVLMTTAWQDVVKEDLVTPAGPFDFGSGRVDLAAAARAGLAFDETAERMALLGPDPVTQVNLNLPNISASVVPGRLTTSRIATNITDRRQRYDLSAVSPAGATITVSPRRIDLAPGDSVRIDVTITVNGATSQRFGEVVLTPRSASLVPQHLPVSFTPTQGQVTLGSSCVPANILLQAQTAQCTITAQNGSYRPTTVELTSTLSRNLRLAAARGAARTGGRSAAATATLPGKTLGVPSVAAGDSPGYVALSTLGIAPRAVGDETIVNYTVPGFVYNGVTYTRLGVDSNGYVVVGGATAADNRCCDLPDGPSDEPPNNVLAPFWTDLDGTGAPGIYVGVVTSGTNRWIVVEWQVYVYDTTSIRKMQVWMRTVPTTGTAVQDVTFSYDPAALPADPGEQDFLVGAENELGQGDVEAVLPTRDLVVTSTAPAPGGSLTYDLIVRGVELGQGTVRTEMVTPAVPGVTVVESPVNVVR